MTSMSRVLQSVPFSEAKSQLSELMTDVVHNHQPKVVNRHHGKEEMLLLGRDEARELLEGFAFQPKISVSTGEFIVRLPEFGLISGGASLDDAYDELLELADAYTQDYLGRWAFFRETDRRQQLPWVLRFATTTPSERRGLFSERPAVGARAFLTA